MFDTRQMEYIIAIAEEGSLTKAAERLYLSQSALSQQLAKLQSQGLPPLFEYKNNRMEPTTAGKIYLNGARAILKIKSDTVSRIQMGSSFECIPVTLSAPIFLHPMIAERILLPFKEKYPNVPVVLLPSFREKESDLKLTIIGHDAESFEGVVLKETILELSGLESAKLRTLPVSIPENEDPFYHPVMTALAANKLKRKTFARTSSPDAALMFVKSGKCIAFLEQKVLNSNPDLTAIPLRKPCIARYFLSENDICKYSEPHHFLSELITKEFKTLPSSS